MKKSFSIKNVLFSISFALICFLSVLSFVSCNEPKFPLENHTSNLVFPKEDFSQSEEKSYSINGNFVSNAYWKEFISLNKDLFTAKNYGSSYGEKLSFKMQNDDLIYSYGSTYSSFSGKVIAFDDSISDGKNGFVFVIQTENNHTNYENGHCFASPENFEASKKHTCYLPIYFAFTNEGLVNASYYKNDVACFYKKDDAIKNGKFSTEIYGYAVTYPTLSE